MEQMTPEYNLDKIYSFLKNYGIDKKFIREFILPDWWDDEVVKSKSGYLQTISLIAKNLGVNISDLLSSSQELTFKLPLIVKYKTAKNVELNRQNIWPMSLAIRLSEIVEETYSVRPQIMFTSATSLRKAIFEKYSIITLANVLDYLWLSGIPVLHVAEYPHGMRKMDGMVMSYNERPIIILSKKRTHDAWLLFTLSHELGHIGNGHLSSKENIIFDTDIENTDQDREEMEANNYGLELLLGRNYSVITDANLTSAFKLTNLARIKSKELKIDPGIVILNFAYTTKKWALAEQALKIVNPHAGAVELIRQKMKDYLDLNKLSEESYDYFSKLTLTE